MVRQQVTATAIVCATDAMAIVETQIQRAPSLGKWFVDIVPDNRSG